MDYWQIAAALARLEMFKKVAEGPVADVKAASEALAKALAANGYDPKKNYRLNDSDESVTEVPTDGPPA